MKVVRARAVIADDRPLVLVGLQKAFAQAGIEVVGIANDASALMDLLSQTHRDVVVTDYSMPRGGVFDGRRLLASLSNEFPSLPGRRIQRVRQSIPCRQPRAVRRSRPG
jgi:two-component system, NarL family, captular synthesis response regulator RcsB